MFSLFRDYETAIRVLPMIYLTCGTDLRTLRETWRKGLNSREQMTNWIPWKKTWTIWWGEGRPVTFRECPPWYKTKNATYNEMPLIVACLERVGEIVNVDTTVDRHSTPKECVVCENASETWIFSLLSHVFTMTWYLSTQLLITIVQAFLSITKTLEHTILFQTFYIVWTVFTWLVVQSQLTKI